MFAKYRDVYVVMIQSTSSSDPFPFMAYTKEDPARVQVQEKKLIAFDSWIRKITLVRG